MDGQDKHADGIMVALLPTTSYWTNLELPHMTLVYAGKVDDHNPGDFNKLAKEAGALAMMNGPIVTKVLGFAVFGDDEAVNVLRLLPTPELLAMRTLLEGWNESQFKEFKPHCTVGLVSEDIPAAPPTELVFDKICVVYGTEQISFWLKNHYFGGVA